MLRCLVSVAVMTLLASAGLADAAGVPTVGESLGPVELGTPLRVMLLQQPPADGDFQGCSTDTLLLSTDWGPRRIAFPTISRIHLRASRGKGGLLVGAGAGVVAGAGLGLVTRGLSEGQKDWSVVPLAATAVGLVGGLTGWTVGSAIPDWRLIYRRPASTDEEAHPAGGGKPTGSAGDAPDHVSTRRWLADLWLAGGAVRAPDASAVGAIFAGLQGYLTREISMGPGLLYHEVDEETSGSSMEGDFHHEMTFVGIDGRVYPLSGIIRPYVSTGVGVGINKSSYMWQSPADSLWRKGSSDDSSMGFSVGAGVRVAPLFRGTSFAIEGRWAGNETVVFHRALLACLVIAW